MNFWRKISRYIEKFDIFFEDTIRYNVIENDISIFLIYRIITATDASACEFARFFLRTRTDADDVL